VQEPVQGVSDLAFRPSMASPDRILAGPSEVLVSQTASSRGRGLTFEDVGEHEDGIPRTAGTSTGW
jgi:hypothetical protein